MDEAKEDQDMSVAQRCAEKSNLNWDNIDTCSTGTMGHDLELVYYNMTASLEPPHKYTPWITINGKVTELHNVCSTLMLALVCNGRLLYIHLINILHLWEGR